MTTDLMTIAEASAYLRMSRGQLAALRYTGRGPKYRKPTAKTVLYVQSDLEEWINASERVGTSSAIHVGA